MGFEDCYKIAEVRGYGDTACSQVLFSRKAENAATAKIPTAANGEHWQLEMALQSNRK